MFVAFAKSLEKMPPPPPPKPKPTKKVIAISDEGDLATIPEEVTPIVPELETSTVVSDEQLEANPDDSEDGDKVAEASTTVEPEPTEPQQAPDQPEDTATAATDAVEPEKPEDAPLADDLDTPEYDEVVEAIVSDESDTLLAVQDRQLVKPTPPAKPRRSFAAILKSWWRKRPSGGSLLGFLWQYLVVLPHIQPLDTMRLTRLAHEVPPRSR
jgi:hypothetical protein